MAVRPLVSALIPAYNHAAYVTETLESLALQDYPRLEVVILNDGSTDNTSAIITEFERRNASRFERFVFIDKNNEGLLATLNRGLTLARGEFIFHLASDDRLAAPDALSVMVDAACNSPDIGLVCGDASFIDDHGNARRHVHRGRHYDTFVEMNGRPHSRFLGINVREEFGYYRTLLVGNYIPVGLLVRKCIYDACGKYQEGRRLDDQDLWLRMSKQYRFVLIPRILAQYRIHGSNSGKLLGKSIALEMTEILLRERTYAHERGHQREWAYGMLRAWGRALKQGDVRLVAEMVRLRRWGWLKLWAEVGCGIAARRSRKWISRQ